MSQPAYTTSLWLFALAQGLLIALFGGAAFVRALVTDVSHWFYATARHRCGDRPRQAIILPARSGRRSCSTSSQTVGQRQTHLGIGIVVRRDDDPARTPMLRRRPPGAPTGNNTPHHIVALSQSASRPPRCRSRCRLPGSAAVSRCRCRRCISSPYCGDLGYGATRGRRRCCR